MTDDEREQAIRGWLADQDLADARQGRYETTYLVATGQVTTDKVIEQIHTLMTAIADGDAWLHANDPLEWRELMINLLHDLFYEYCTLVERARIAAPQMTTVATPNGPGTIATPATTTPWPRCPTTNATTSPVRSPTPPPSNR